MSLKVYYWWEGQVLNEAPSIPVTHRLARFGDGLFETIRVWNAKPLWLSDHLERLKTSLDFFQITFHEGQVIKALEQLITTSGIDAGRLKLCAFRRDAGGYAAASTAGDFFLELSELNSDQPFPFKVVDIKLVSSPDAGILSIHKTMNALPWIYAGLKVPEDAEGIKINNAGEVTEGLTTNIFYQLNQHWYTTPLSAGILAGTMRKRILTLSPSIKERNLAERELPAVTSMFLTNAVKGIWSVKNLNDYPTQHEFAASLAVKLNEAAESY